jgi:hypothetical protein
MKQRQVRWFVVGAAAAASVVAIAAPAGASPSNAKNSITFVDTVCTNLNPPNITRKLDFVVNGNGRDGAHTAMGIFQPLALEVSVNGVASPEDSFVKHNVGKADWGCNGQATLDTPGGPVVIAFTALGQFKP